MFSPTRRDLLAATAGAAVLPGLISTVRADSRKPVLRAAHITDVHITKDRNAVGGTAAMFSHLAGQNDRRESCRTNCAVERSRESLPRADPLLPGQPRCVGWCGTDRGDPRREERFCTDDRSAGDAGAVLQLRPERLALHRAQQHV